MSSRSTDAEKQTDAINLLEQIASETDAINLLEPWNNNKKNYVPEQLENKNLIVHMFLSWQGN